MVFLVFLVVTNGTQTFNIPLALRILKYLIDKKELRKTKNTIKVSEFDLICGSNFVFGVRVPLNNIFSWLFKG